MSVRCGNRIHTEPTNHESAAAVRACFQGNHIPAPRQPERTALGAIVNERLVRAHADNPRTAQVLANVGAGNQWREDEYGNYATPGQVQYIEGLSASRDLTCEISATTRRTAQAVMDGERVSFEAARSALDEMTKLPYKRRETDADSPQGEQGTRTKDSGLVARIKALKALVPDGRYACKPDGVGQDKLHFYLVQIGKTGHVFVKEYASDTLWPVSFPSYEVILGQIVRDDPEYAGVLFGREYGHCRRCGRGLTDENNPYREMGYGPDCGAKL